jgi:hypothetical protein
MAKVRANHGKKTYGLRLEQGLMKELQYLGVDQDRWVNDLVEEAIQDLLKKYREKKGLLPKGK